MLCVLLPPMFAYHFGTFGDKDQRFGHLLLAKALIGFTIMAFVCFVQVAENNIADLFMMGRFWSLTDDGHLRANEKVAVPLSSKLKANIL